MIIRPFIKDDAYVVSDIIIDNIRNVNSTDYPKEVIEGLVKDHQPDVIIERAKNRTIIIADDNGIIGTGAIDRNWIRNVFVFTACHKKGIGKRLMEELEKTAQQKGVKTLFLYASKTAIGFYKKLGYKLIREENVEIDGIEFIVFKMEKDL